MTPPRLLLAALLAGALLVTGCSGAALVDPAQANAPEPATSVPDPGPGTAVAPTTTMASDTAAAPTTTMASDTAAAPTTTAVTMPDVETSGEASDTAAAPTTTAVTMPDVETSGEAVSGTEDTTRRPETEPVTEEAPGDTEIPTLAQRDDNQTDTQDPKACAPGTEMSDGVRIVAATVTPSLFMITEQGQEPASSLQPALDVGVRPAHPFGWLRPAGDGVICGDGATVVLAQCERLVGTRRGVGLAVVVVAPAREG